LESTVVVATLIDPPTPNLTLEGHRPQPVDDVDVNFGFELLTEDLEVVPWTLNGPSKDIPTTVYYTELAAFSNTSIYVFDESTNQFRTVDRATQTENITAPVPSTFPTVDEPSAAVIDTKRQIITLIARYSVYRYNITAQSWLDVVTTDSFGFTSVVYDQVRDQYVGIGFLSANIVYISNDWKQYDVVTADLASRLPGFGRLYDANNGFVPHLLLAQRGDDEFALIHVGGGMFEPIIGQPAAAPVPIRVWHYNVANDQANLTYAAP
jgi:hypothetical protein